MFDVQLVAVSAMPLTPIPTRVAILEERTARIDANCEEMKATLDDIRILLAQRAGRETAYANVGHFLTVGISALVSAIVSWTPNMWPRK